MAKLFLNEKFKFFTKITLAHVITYFLCGIVFANLLSYDDSFLTLMGFKPMDEINGIISTYGPAHGFIEGFIYLTPVDVPVNNGLSILEVLTQPLLFSIMVTYQRKKK